LWSRIWGSNADDLAGGVASDAAGNLYVGGSSRGPIDGQPHQGNFDYYLSKFSPDGTRLWTRMGGSSAQDFGYKVALDPAGMIYLSGYTQGAFDGQTNMGGFDGFLVQYLPDGSRGWTRLWGSPADDIPYDLGVDDTGSILVSGYTEGAFDGQGNQGATDLFLTRFFPDGTRNRTCLWGSATNDVGSGIALVSGGALFVAGCTAGAFDGQTNAGGQDMLLTHWVPQATARIVSQPTNQTVIAGATASFQVVASGSAPLSYQWFFNQTNLLAGATNAALTLTNAQSANAGSYNVVVSYSCSSVTSQVAILRVLEPTPSVHYVDGGSANPVSPFGSWGTAARRIQDAVAVAVAVDGDTVLVTNGVYLPDNQITITNGVTVTSVNGPQVTVVDGGYPARTGRCFVLSHSDAVLEGFTIRGGYAHLGGGVRMTASDLANDRTLVWASPASDYVTSPVLDADGNLYVASTSCSSDSCRIFVEKHAPGGTGLWVTELRSDAGPSCLQLDGLGHLYVGGCVGSGPNDNTRDAYLVKLDLQGNVLWERTWGSSLHDFVYGLQTDAAGNVYASGYTWGDIDGAAKPGYDDLFVSMFTPDGDRPWTRLYGTFADEVLGLLLPDGQGGFYLVGYENEPGPQLHLPRDFRFARLTADGTEVWMQLVGIPGRDEQVYFAGADSGGSVYGGGVTDGATNAVTGALESGVYLAKLQPDGSTAWTRCWDMPVATVTGVAGAVDPAGNVYLAAPGEMTADGTIHPRSDIYLWKISSAGEWQWCKPFGIGTNAYLAGLTLDGAGGLYLDWYSYGGFEGHVNAGLYDSYLAHWTFDNPFGGLMSRCIVEDNQAEQGGGVALGQLGGLRNCLMVGNTASGLGGGVYSQGGTVESSTISSNSALCGGGLYIDGPVQVANSILYGNTAGAWADCAPSDATALVSYSLVGTGSVPGTGNITGDPRFVNPAGGDYRLGSGSPCVDAGLVQLWMFSSYDLDNHPRVQGAGVDLGAYESGSSGEPEAPAITVQPRSQTVFAGADVVFGVKATGTPPLSYQWRLNGTNLLGATNLSLFLPAVTAADAGNYTVVVTNVAGSTNSLPAVLTVIVSPTITVQPSDRTVRQREDVEFDVTAVGSQPLSYQWFFNQTIPLAGATNSSLILTNVQMSQAGSYRVTITNVAGSVTSTAASLTVIPVNSAPVLAAIGNTNVDEATLLTFKVTASDADIPAQTLTYTLEPGSPVGAVINGSSGVFSWIPTYAESASTNLITVKVTDNGTPPLSDSGSFTVAVRRVSVPPTILTPPQSQMALVGADVTFNVVAGGTAPLSYQWRFNGIPINGATNSNLYLSAVQTNQAGYYSVVVTNLAGSATSAAALLTLKLPATLTGTVSDALNGQPLAGVAVSAGGRTNLTDLQGRYVLTNLAEGVLKADFDADVTSGPVPLTVHFLNLSTTDALTVRGEKTGYATYQNRQVRVSAGKTNELNFSMSPALSQGMRVVLNWGPVPKDLDLHMQIEGTSHEVSYNDRDTPYGRLDHDVTDGWGPETLTVDQFYPGLYHYYIEHYDVFMPGARLTNSAAQAHLYRGVEELKVVSVPTEGSGAYWHVCVVDGETGAIRLVNQITDSEALPTGGTMGGGGGALAGLAFAWDFGDGSTSTNESPVKEYGRPGSYTVGLRVEGEQGQSDGKVRVGFVVVGVGNAAWLSLEWVGGQAAMSVSGVVGKTYRIESTSRLGPAAVWQTVATLTLSSPVQTWRDDQSGNLTTRFYRAVSP
jgi:PKD repeat protein